jgi:hypothetical protein
VRQKQIGAGFEEDGDLLDDDLLNFGNSNPMLAMDRRMSHLEDRGITVLQQQKTLGSTTP